MLQNNHYLSPSKIIAKINNFISDKSSFTNLASSANFLYFSCLLIFLTSIFIRSRINIGPDTGIYISLAEKIINGKRYYYDFYESNFPLSFYFYVWQYYFSYATGIHPVITSEIFINVFALASILLSARILKKTTIYDNKAYYNLIIIGCFLGFFIRNPAILIGEFGTKTSIFLILVYPYIAYSFERKLAFSKKDLLLRGLLMGLIPCVKPCYIALVAVVEIYHFLQVKKLKFFFELDKIIAMVVGVSYLLMIVLLMPEFLTYMVPMWSKNYPPYKNLYNFFSKTLNYFVVRAIFPLFTLLVFLYQKISKNDKILIAIFLGSYLTLILETGSSDDQISTYNGVAIIVLLKFCYDFFSSPRFSFFDNKFIVLLCALLPLFDLNNFFVSIFGIVNIWWIVLPICFLWLFYKIKIANNFSWPDLVKSIKISNFIAVIILLAFLATIALCLIFSVPYGSDLATNYVESNKKLTALLSFYTIINFISFFIGVYFFEKINKKFFKKFSPILIVIMTILTSRIFCSYFVIIADAYASNGSAANLKKVAKEIALYAKIYAPKKNDKILLFSELNMYIYPLNQYLNKENNYKFYSVISLYNQRDKSLDKNITSPSNPIFVDNYFYDSLISQMQNNDVKIIVADNSMSPYSRNPCALSYLEKSFFNPEFKEIFFKNFSYKGHIIISAKPRYRATLLKKRKKDVFDNIKPSKKYRINDFDVYVRKPVLAGSK